MTDNKDVILSTANDLESALQSGNNAGIISILELLDGVTMTPQILRSTTIGKIVGKLRKHSNTEFARLASSLVGKWKTVLDEPASGSSAKTLTDFLLTDLSRSPPRDLALFADTTSTIHAARSRELFSIGNGGSSGQVVYWMSRDQRVHDNWALLKAQEIALRRRTGLAIVFCLASSFLGANIRHYGFMLRGLKELEARALSLGIPFYILIGTPEVALVDFCGQHGVGTVVTDFSPLRIGRKWKNDVSSALTRRQREFADGVSFIEVDAHNIAPCWHVSDKCEFAAKTIRTKIHLAMNTFLTEFPPVVAHPHAFAEGSGASSSSSSDAKRSSAAEGPRGGASWQQVSDVAAQIDSSVPEVTWLTSGEAAAVDAMRAFVPRLRAYGEQRNDPSIANGVSNLSPYFHFGQLSVQRVLVEIMRSYKCGKGALFPSGERTSGIHSFCEEAVVRKELSDNFCLYNSKYDSIEGAHSWAQATLRDHWSDPRAVSYSSEQLEGALTADPLWNAAQTEMAVRGKMHGFMRMYWAKKILEWTPSPDEALRLAIYLNDKYSIDGRDPNGYVGCMWAIAGVHDRAWGPVRPVFGTIRFMNYDGCKRKFDIAKYIARISAEKNALRSGSAVSSSSQNASSISSFFAKSGQSKAKTPREEVVAKEPAAKKAKKTG